MPPCGRSTTSSRQAGQSASPRRTPRSTRQQARGRFCKKDGVERHVGERKRRTSWPVKKPRIAHLRTVGRQYRRGLDALDSWSSSTSRSRACIIADVQIGPFARSVRHHHVRRNGDAPDHGRACGRVRCRDNMRAASVTTGAHGAARFRDEGRDADCARQCEPFAIEQFNLPMHECRGRAAARINSSVRARCCKRKLRSRSIPLVAGLPLAPCR